MNPAASGTKIVVILSVLLKKTERSVSIILGILGNLGHFRHSLIYIFERPCVSLSLFKPR